MNFNQYNDDIDVYSLCESVYYSCNNDEYDYVLECVNDWIMNGYNDNILLEDIVLNEKYTSPEDFDSYAMTLFYKHFPQFRYYKTSRDEEPTIKEFLYDLNFYRHHPEVGSKVEAFARRYYDMSSRLETLELDRVLRNGSYEDRLNFIRDNDYDKESRKKILDHPQELLQQRLADEKKYNIGPISHHDNWFRKQYKEAFKDLRKLHTAEQIRQEFNIDKDINKYNDILKLFLNPKLSHEDIKKVLGNISSEQLNYVESLISNARSEVKPQSKRIISQSQKRANIERDNILNNEYYPFLNKMRQQYGVKKISDLPPDVQTELSSIWNKAKEAEKPKISLIREIPKKRPKPTPLEDQRGKPAIVPEQQDTPPVQHTKPVTKEEPSKPDTPPVQPTKPVTKEEPSKPETPPLQPATAATPKPERKVEKQQDTPPVQPTKEKNNPVTKEEPKPQPPRVVPKSRLSRFTNYMKNNKVKGGLGVVAAGAAIGGSIYAYKRFKNKPRSVIAKRIAALRGVYHKFMINAQRNPKKANVFKRIAAKILSVIDKLLHYLQNKADGR